MFSMQQELFNVIIFIGKFLSKYFILIGEECGSMVIVTKSSNMEKIKLKPTRCSNEDCTSVKFKSLKESL
jgi:hypothetical protein